jgi:6-phosphofructokinase 1
MEIGFDVGSMATDEGSCCIVEVMGRDAGWIAAGTIVAKRVPAEDGSHRGRRTASWRAGPRHPS